MLLILQQNYCIPNRGAHPNGSAPPPYFVKVGILNLWVFKASRYYFFLAEIEPCKVFGDFVGWNLGLYGLQALNLNISGSYNNRA